jgi:hypothetical protein
VNSIVHGFGFGLDSNHLPITIVVALIVGLIVVVMQRRRSRQRGRKG